MSPIRFWLTGVLCASALLLTCDSVEGQGVSRWKAHDMSRPRPPKVKPGKQDLPVAAPEDAIMLFDGKDLSNWTGPDGIEPKWIVRDGHMESAPESGYVYTKETFGDCQLHVEWASPEKVEGRSQGRGNSGVFLMGLFEVQVLDSFDNDTYPDGQAAAIYGQFPPLVNASRGPGEWQTYDISFRKPRYFRDGRLDKPARITVFHNGVLVQDNVEPWGPTSWLEANKYDGRDQGPLGLQDHGNPVRFRNIWIRKLSERRDDDPPTDTTKTVQLSGAALDRLVGEFGAEKSFGFSVERSGSGLQMVAGTRRLDLIPISGTELAMRWTAGKLEFEFEGDRCKGAYFHLGGDRSFIPKREQAQSAP